MDNNNNTSNSNGNNSKNVLTSLPWFSNLKDKIKRNSTTEDEQRPLLGPSLPTAASENEKRRRHDDEQRNSRPALPPRAWKASEQLSRNHASNDTLCIPDLSVPSALGSKRKLTLTQPIDAEEDESQAVISEHPKRSYHSIASSPLRSVHHNQVEEIRVNVDSAYDAAHAVVEKLLKRGEKLEDLKSKTTRLEGAADLFSRRTRNVAASAWYKKHKLNILYYSATAFLLVVFIALMTLMLHYIYKKLVVVKPATPVPTIPPPAQPMPTVAPAPIPYPIPYPGPPLYCYTSPLPSRYIMIEDMPTNGPKWTAPSPKPSGKSSA